MKFYKLEIISIERNTNDSVVIEFLVPEKIKPIFKFNPGQYLTLRKNINGKEIVRCYSICSSNQDKELKVAIKSILNGTFSQYANRDLCVGDFLEVMSPQGEFGFVPRQGKAKHYLGVAAGSGITPIISLVKSVLQTEVCSHFTLLYGNKDLQSTMFKEQLSELKDFYKERLRVIYVFSREKQDNDLFYGRLDEEKIRLISKSTLDFKKFDSGYICGPDGMVNKVYSALIFSGVNKDDLYVERFNSESEGEMINMRNETKNSKVKIINNGGVIDINTIPSDKCILDAALRESIYLPHACKVGMCGICKCKVKEGKVKMHKNNSFEQEKLKKGYVLSCQAIPMTDNVIIEFDS